MAAKKNPTKVKTVSASAKKASVNKAPAAKQGAASKVASPKTAPKKAAGVAAKKVAAKKSTATERAPTAKGTVRAAILQPASLVELEQDALIEVEDDIVSEATLERAPARAFQFLTAISANRALRVALMTRDYTPAEHHHGWSLLERAGGRLLEFDSTTDDLPVRRAITVLDNWDEDGFRLVRAALSRRHPEQAKFVLEGLGPSRGAAAVLGVEQLLQRLDALESSPERKATRAADHAALDTLSRRGIDAAERQRLAELVVVAKSLSAPDLNLDQAYAEQDSSRRAAQAELREWYLEWAETARAVVKRRDWLIQLGLAHRRSPRSETSSQPLAPEATPTEG